MANVESGKVISILPERTGVSTRTGETWKSQDFIIETNERFPRKIVFNIWDEDKIVAANLKLGESIDVIFYPDSHEFNNNWYTDLKVTDICQNGFSRLVQSKLNFAG